MPVLAAETARIFLIDDHPAIRSGLKLLFSDQNFTVSGEAEAGAEALAKIGASEANLAILDLSLGDECGFDLIAFLRQKMVEVLIYSMHEDADTIRKSFNLGASGYVTKREESEILCQAVTECISGKRFVSPRATKSLTENKTSSQNKKQEIPFSERERQILYLLGRGETNIEIAAALVISVRTVETHFVRIIAKLKLDGMKELRRYAIKEQKQ